MAGAAQILDFSQPVAVLHFIPDSDDPYGIVARLMGAMPSGSYLAIVHAASDIRAAMVGPGMGLYNQTSPAPITLRARPQATRFFDGSELAGPGVVPMDEWWSPDHVEHGARGTLAGYSGIARKL